MTHAFKCDSCRGVFDGHSPRSKDLRVGDLLMRVQFGRKGEDMADVKETTHVSLDQLPPGLGTLLGIAHEIPEELDGKALHTADLCPECWYKVLTQALMQAQAEGVAALLDASGPINNE